MSKVLKLALFLLMTVPAVAQGGAIWGQVIGPAGTNNPVAFATILVCPFGAIGVPCSPTANLFADPGLTQPVSNPFTTDQFGNYSFYVGQGYYITQIQATSTVVYSYVMSSNGNASVSSVALSLPSSLFSVTGSPITNAGTITASLIAQTANEVFGNCTSSSSVPTFCNITAAMLPATINSNTTGNAATATMLQNLPTICPFGQYAIGILQNGNATCGVFLPGVTSWNGRTGAVVPTTGDYSFSQISGIIANSQIPTTISANTTGNAATANGFTLFPTQCTSGQVATGVNQQGNANCITNLRVLGSVTINPTCSLQGNNGEWNCLSVAGWPSSLGTSNYKVVCQLSNPQPSGSYTIPSGYDAGVFIVSQNANNFTYVINDDHSGSNNAFYIMQCIATQ